MADLDLLSNYLHRWFDLMSSAAYDLLGFATSLCVQHAMMCLVFLYSMETSLLTYLSFLKICSIHSEVTMSDISAI